MNTVDPMESNHRNLTLSEEELPSKSSSERDIRKERTPKSEPDTKITSIWTKDSFNDRKIARHELSLNIPQGNAMSWQDQIDTTPEDIEDSPRGKYDSFADNFRDKQTEKREETQAAIGPTSPPAENETTSPAHHARRPMNAFLIFCKKHRPIVRKKFPNLENRGVTRILGEWWAMLDNNDKEPYKNLAKEYKDAFFSANPGFKWYKLPAPPLRTLTTRPGSVQKEPLPPQSPTAVSTTAGNGQQLESEFTPGKLADESQLGNLTSLMRTDFAAKTPETDCGSTTFGNNIKITDDDESAESDLIKRSEITERSPPNLIREPPDAAPPKPIKKRKFYEEFPSVDHKGIVRNIFDDSPNKGGTENCVGHQEKISNRELMDKVVENMFQFNQENGVNKNIVNNNNNFNNNISNSNIINNDGNIINNTNNAMLKEPRKSERSCKGLKYIEFMANGKLLKNKREKTVVVHTPSFAEVTSVVKKEEEKSEKLEKLDLQQTIRRLAERTNKIIPEFSDPKEKPRPRVYTNSESSSEENFAKNEFNLEDRISGLPTLNYDVYTQRKRESKKRKLPKSKHVVVEAKRNKLQTIASNLNNNNNNNNNTYNNCNSNVNINNNNNNNSNNNNNIPIGSQKRKNKQSITHLETKDTNANNNNDFVCSTDLSGLTTLAEIAANSQKIN